MHLRIKAKKSLKKVRRRRMATRQQLVLTMVPLLLAKFPLPSQLKPQCLKRKSQMRVIAMTKALEDISRITWRSSLLTSIKALCEMRSYSLESTSG